MNENLIKFNIQKLRKNRGISQSELAESIFSTKQNISKYERGEVFPPIHVLLDIANYFDVTLDDLVNDYLISNKLDIILNYKTFLKHYDTKIINQSLSNIKLSNDIYISNINKELAIIDHFEDTPNIEYIKNHSLLNLEDFMYTIGRSYNRKLENSIIHHTDSLLTVSELLKIINSLGANYDYFKKPGSLKLEITDEFIALAKLAAISEVNNDKILLELEYNDLLLSQYLNTFDITFSEVGYNKIRNHLSKIVKDKYNEEFDVRKIDPPRDEAHFLEYVVGYKNQLPKSLDKLYDEFNNKSSNVFYEIGLSFTKAFTEATLDKLLPEKFDIKVNYNLRKPKISINGIMSNISESSNKADQSSFVNYLITELYKDINIEKIWENCYKEYFMSLGLNYNVDDFNEVSFVKKELFFRQKKDDFMKKYNEFIKTKWVFNNVKLLDIKTLKIIKSIIHKEIIK